MNPKYPLLVDTIRTTKRFCWGKTKVVLMTIWLVAIRPVLPSYRFSPLTVYRIAFLVDQICMKFCKMPTSRLINFGYMPKTNLITGKAYQTSLNSKIKVLKTSSACRETTKNFCVCISSSVKNVLKTCKKVGTNV